MVEYAVAMTILILLVHIAVCLVLILVVLLQTGKRADLAGAFGGGGSQTAFGARGAATFLSKATAWSAGIFMVTSLILGVRFGKDQGESVVKEPSQQSGPSLPAPSPAPLPTPAPAPAPARTEPLPPGSSATPSPAAPKPAETPKPTPVPKPPAGGKSQPE